MPLIIHRKRGELALIPWLPILIPLVGAAICPWRFVAHDQLPLRRWLYAALVALTGVAMAVAGSQGVPGKSAMLLQPYLGEAPAVVWTPLGVWVGGLLIIVLLVGQLSRGVRSLAPEHASLRLLLLAAAMGVLSADNYYVLALAWSVPVIVLLLLRALWRGGEAERPAPWDIWANLFSGGLLVVGAIATIAEQGGELALGRIGPGLGLGAFLVAVALRTLRWPRAGGLRRHWDSFMLLLVPALYLWVRVSLSLGAVEAPVNSAATTVALIALVLLGLLGALHRQPGRALPYVLAHWLLLALLAPLLDPTLGAVVGVLVIWQLAFTLLALRLYQTSGLSTRRLGRVFYLIAWASLGGLPLTTGFVIQWLVLRSCWEAGVGHLSLWLLLSYLANALPAWVQGFSWNAPPAIEPLRARLDYGLLAAAGLPALALLLVGVYPGLLGALVPQAPAELGLLNYDRLFACSPSPGFWPWAVALVPLLAGWALLPWVAQARMPTLRPFYRSRRLVNVEWLYAAATEQVDRLATLVEGGLRAFEGPFALGWVLLWGLVLVYWMAGA